MIRIDGVWLATQPPDMRAGINAVLARVANVFGAAHTASLFVNQPANRLEVLGQALHAPLMSAAFEIGIGPSTARHPWRKWIASAAPTNQEGVGDFGLNLRSRVGIAFLGAYF
ncbi:MAG TPA: hypothetical protein PLB25_12740 [Rhodoferax sp.]|nr:hypothetical protein [Rhodoferax sp.]